MGEAEVRMLDAEYFDTPDLSLSGADIALRRRTGGPDEGWHIKGPRIGDARVEIAWPLTIAAADSEVPDAIAEAIAEWATPPFTSLARIRNTRHAYALTTPEGVVAEFVDDHVDALDVRGGVARTWREWEVELGPAAPTDGGAREALFAALEEAILATGAKPAASASKLARALGH